jgi:hypothetical protein
VSRRDLIFIIGTDLCEVRAEAEETGDDLNITTEEDMGKYSTV